MFLSDPGPALVISPHLDDAVFSCGELIAGLPRVTVLTVFAGIPGNGKEQARTAWDERSGFGNAGEAMRARRQEDQEALGLLGADPLWLDFLDSQYGATPAAGEVAGALADAISALDPGVILFPSGLFHSDHALVHEAALLLLPDRRQRQWIMYEEALYRRFPALLQQRLASLCGAGIGLTPRVPPDRSAQERKRRAVDCYASQLRALQRSYGDDADIRADIRAPERYWHVEEPAPLRKPA